MGRATCRTMPRRSTQSCRQSARICRSCATASSGSAIAPTPRPSISAASVSTSCSPSWARNASASACSTMPRQACWPRKPRWNGPRSGLNWHATQRRTPRRGEQSMGMFKADHSVSPPRVEIAREYNAAEDLIGRNLAAGRGGKIAYIDDAGQCSYAELAERVDRLGSGLQALGLGMEDRIALAMLDTIDWPVAFLGAIKAGVVPIALNTLLTTKDYEFMLSDSRAQALLVSEALLPAFAPLIGRMPFLRHVIVSGSDAKGHLAFRDVLAK